jgi:hypothetical protein
MQINPKKNYAVISGDFIGFSNLAVKIRKGMYFTLKTSGKELAIAFPKIMPCEVDMFRGDGWQMLLTDPVMSLCAALFFRAHLRASAPERKTDTRLSIAVGKIDYVPENRVSAGDGAAFRASGRLLEKMSRAKSASMRFVMEDKKASLALDRIARQVGALADQWTPNQARAVLGALKGLTQEQISATWTKKISSNSLAQLLNQANWPASKDLLSAFESTLSKTTR